MSLRIASFLLALCFADASLKHNKAPKQVLALDHDGQTQMLIEVQSSGTRPACDAIKCADPLTCPPGFQSTKVEGQCCPFCVNPDIKIEPEVTGATGKTGGTKSAFCPDVWCFPTMCTKEEVMPTTENGMCCAQCPK